MARPEFPSLPIGAENGKTSEQNGAVPLYRQLSLEGLVLESNPGEEMELGNCQVTSTVTFRKRVKGNEWHCSIHVEPDLLHPDQEGDYEAVAYSEYADRAYGFHLRPGDRATLQGFHKQEEIELANGETITTNYFYVTDVQPLSRSRRTSVTAYERENGGDKKR
jgi:hypothetical protein